MSHQIILIFRGPGGEEAVTKSNILEELAMELEEN